MSRITLRSYSSFFSNYKLIIVCILIFTFLLIQIVKAVFPPAFFHPDEIYQSYEIGHYYYYGYGIRAWEWLSPDQSDWTAPFIGPARSLITPLIFYILFGIGEFLNFNYWLQTLPMIRIFLGINTTFGLIGLSLLIKEIFPKFKENLLIIFWLIVIIYPDTILYGTTGLTNVIALSPLFWGLYLYFKSLNERKMNNLRMKSYLAGFILGISIWIRPDFAIITIIFFILFNPFFYNLNQLKQLITGKIFFNSNLQEDSISSDNNKKVLLSKRFSIRKNRALNSIISLFAGGLFSFTINGLLDYFMWGEFSVSILRFIDFNGNPENQAIFGTEPAGWYFENIIHSKEAMNWLFTLVIFMLIISLLIFFLHLLQLIIKKFSNFKQFNHIHLIDLLIIKFSNLKQFKKIFFSDFNFNFLRLSLMLFLIFDWWENQPHKEFRFLLAWEYLFFCLTAITIVFLFTILIEIVKYFLTIVSKRFSYLTIKKINFIRLVSAVIIITLIFVPYYMGVNSQARNIPWNNFDDILGAQVFVGQQEDLTGLIILGGYWYDGGYTYLHRNVSVKRIDNPGTNSSFKSDFVFNNEYNYAIVPHYKYYQYPFLRINLEENNWTFISLILGRTDVWKK